MERIDFFECLIVKRAPTDISNLLEFYQSFAEYKAECSVLLNSAHEDFLADKKSKEKGVLYRRFKSVYNEMGSRMRSLTTQISAEKALLLLEPNNTNHVTRTQKN